jgi:hypothetical protein
MVAPQFRRFLPLMCFAIAVIAFVVPINPASACPFCGQAQQTMLADFPQASFVVFGTLKDAKMDGEFGGTTDLVIEKVLKDNDYLKEKKTISIPRYLPYTDGKTKFLVYCDIFKDRLDPFRGVPVRADSDLIKYLEGAQKVRDKSPAERLSFCFDYLDNAESEISNDAYNEFARADYEDYHGMAKKLNPDRITKWLRDPNTPTFRYGLYASMLGHCGKEEHAKVLREMLEDSTKKLLTGADGILAGYVMLKPKEGREYLTAILKDEKKEFAQRYAALRAVRFFWNSRPDVLAKKDCVEAAALLLPQSDIADLAIEDLRKWKCWDMTDTILKYGNEKSHDIPIIRRSILRFALSAQSGTGARHPAAAAYIEAERAKDREKVQEVEDLLKLENTPAPAKPAGGK